MSRSYYQRQSASESVKVSRNFEKNSVLAPDHFPTRNRVRNFARLNR